MATDTLPRNLLGTDATWVIRNDIGTDNGLPTGGLSKNAPGFPGLGVADASVGLQADAFDNGLLLFVDDQIFVAPETIDVKGSAITTGAIALSGLNVSVQFYADQNQPVLRTLVTFENPSNNPISVPVSWATNVGSNAATTVQDTSSGDTSFTIGDRWVITDDTATGGDPANTFVLFGPGSPTVALSSVSQTVYDFSITAGTEGILANYDITIPANSRRSLLFFNGINPNTSDALTNSLTYDSVNALESSSLLTGMSDAQRAAVLNWRFIPRAVVGTSISDSIKGTRKRDVLFGNEGNDELRAGKGDDLLDGGLGGDIMKGGQGADVFAYTGPTRARTLVTSNLTAKKVQTKVDYLPDLNVRKGDRLVVDYNDTDNVPTKAPRKVYSAGLVRGRTPVKVMKTVFDDANVVRKGMQPLQTNEAVIVKGQTKVSGEVRRYLAINDKSLGFSPKHDLVVDVTGATLTKGFANAVKLNPEDYFLTSSL